MYLPRDTRCRPGESIERQTDAVSYGRNTPVVLLVSRPAAPERLVIYCRATAHAAHCATHCPPCRPLIRAFELHLSIFSRFLAPCSPLNTRETCARPGGLQTPGSAARESRCFARRMRPAARALARAASPPPAVQRYLAHKKLAPPPGPPYDPRCFS